MKIIIKDFCAPVMETCIEECFGFMLGLLGK